ncbi:zinc finger CCCH domain-containing protein 18-like isoform X2 [Nymphaea colorata]|nr:zinc finger CCCH domain-containing protein 18-like isoform X2 [Nymphaea colorata]
MDVYEATRIVYSRIQKLEPENVSKIVGYLLLQDHGDREMIRLAFSPDGLIHSLISKAKLELGLSAKPPATSHAPAVPFSPSSRSDLPLQFTPFSPASSRPFSSPPTFPAVSPYWEPQHLGDPQTVLNLDFSPSSAYGENLGDEFALHNQAHFLGLEDRTDPINLAGGDFPNEPFFPESPLGSLTSRTSRRSPSLPEFPLKPCLYFARGYCKHGTNCRFFHSHSLPDNFTHILNGSQAELSSEDHIFSPGTLERLELDLAQLLRAKRTPVSIASLPQLYYERYGRTLQAEGYLTESQRHGKSGHSLTKLLARMKSIVVIERSSICRPHGQHVVVLTEDAPRYADYRSERSDPGQIVSGSRQIYLTFPAESTFTEEDVSNYFRNYGPVQDVRIPCQQKRMFGFVTFVYPETVRLILTKGNPHFVCGARVLVKPYREKPRLVDRKYPDRLDSPVYYPSQLLELDPAYHSVAGICDNSQLLRKHLLEEQEQALEMERMRLSDLQLTPKPLNSHYFNQPLEDVKHTEGFLLFFFLLVYYFQVSTYSAISQVPLLSADRFSYLFDVLNSGSASEDVNRQMDNNYNDQESSQGLNLPESPFASPMANSIPTAI